MSHHASLEARKCPLCEDRTLVRLGASYYYCTGCKRNWKAGRRTGVSYRGAR